MSHSNPKTITHIWTRFNPKWLISGAISGALAGTIVLAIACLISSIYLGEWSRPLKLLGAICYGSEGLAYGPIGQAGLWGFILHISLSIIYGVTFAQLVDERSKPFSLVALGFVTSLVIWVFGCQLFMPSFNYYLFEALPTVAAVFFHVGFGILFGIILGKLRTKEK